MRRLTMSTHAKAVALRRTGLPRNDAIMRGAMNSHQLVHHGRLDSGVLLLAKPYRKSELARMIRLALAS